MGRSLQARFTINPTSITLCVVVTVLVLFTTDTRILDLIELKTYDLRLQSRRPLQPDPAVVLALIDEKSLDQVGRWPWPRSKIARLIDILSRAEAKVIGFDIGFLEPDDIAVENDSALAGAIRNSSAAIVLGYFFHMHESDLNYHVDPAQIERQLARIKASQYPLIIYENQAARDISFSRAYAPEASLEIFAQAADGAGYYTVKSDQDGVVRSMPLAIQCGDHVFPPLSLSCAWYYLDKPDLSVMVARFGVHGIRMGERFIPTDESGHMLINYLGPPQVFPHVSISDVLSEKVPRKTFQNKIVLIGATAMGTHDLRTTPINPLYPGVAINATVIDNILTQRFIAKPNWSKVYDLLAVIVLGSLMGFVLPRLRAVQGFVFLLLLLALQVSLTWLLFVHYRFWINLVYPLLTLLMTYTSLTVFRYFTEEHERRKIKTTFKQYVSPVIIEEMLKSPDRLKLGGEEKVLTVLFSDLENFTSYSELYPPSEMVDILGEYYEKMTEQVFAHQGTLTDYIADELIAVFGAPIPQADHARQACSAALAMRDRLRSLCAQWAHSGRPQLKARTGINSGLMLVGNLGSRYRFAYGALGDQVNLGSRIEGLNKMYRTEILIGENTAELLGGAFALREIDRVRVMGKSKPVRIFELLEKTEGALAEEKKRIGEDYSAGLALYRRKNWRDALQQFERCLAIVPEDGPAQVMAQRCRCYLMTPPPEDWDGVFEHSAK